MEQPKLIIEVRVNEGTDRSRNPHVPWTPDEIAEDALACVEAGASIIHYDARKPDGGSSSDPEVYIAIERAIRKKGDVITMPTLGALMAAPPEAHLAYRGDGPRSANPSRLRADRRHHHQHGALRRYERAIPR